VARYADFSPGGVVYDACAAPGGKTIALGREVRRVIAADASRTRVGRLVRNLRRAGSGREFPIVADAGAAPVRAVDGVLLDAPCLGTGTFARHPDARWRVRRAALDRLVARQADLLDRLSQVVRPGGLLVYATCSLEPEENEEQVERFLRRRPGFQREPGATVPPELLSPLGDLVILPQRHGVDGAFATRLRRAA
jgi:16S rRNA (cytosine967-C5)-methyltransferase